MGRRRGSSTGGPAGEELGDPLGPTVEAQGGTLRSDERDATGWRWRVTFRGVEVGAWNDMDGVAVVADIGPWDEWVGLAGHPPDPTPVEAFDWAVATLLVWLDQPGHAERLAERTLERRAGGVPDPPSLAADAGDPPDDD